MSDKTEPSVGIDLGTTYSVAATLSRDGNPRTLLNEEGETTTPSVVYFDGAGPIVGREAVSAAKFEPHRVVQFAKREMGEPACEKTVFDQAFPPEVIQALVLRKLKHDAALKIGPFDKAVVTVPAYFDEPRRKATQDAARLAHLEVIDIINEPTAAALAYGVEQGFINERGKAKRHELALVYDLGGGTFDATLMEIKNDEFNTIATAGDVYLGGIDWDERLALHLAEKFHRETGVSIEEDAEAMLALLQEAADAKKALTARQQADVRLGHAGRQCRLTVSRKIFESLTADLLDRTRLTINRLLKEADISWSDLTRLLLVGGSTRMPMVKEMLQSQSGQLIDRSLSPDEAVAHGAAVYAGILTGGAGSPRGATVRNVNSHHLGVLGVDPSTKKPRRRILIPRNTPLPAKRTSKFQTYRDGQQNVAVNVVEGGADSGEGATEIARCIVADLPADLPRGTPVLVAFSYGADGRLTVQAKLPTVKCHAKLTVDRSSGLTDEILLQWLECLDEGLELEEPEGEPHLDDAADESSPFGDAAAGAAAAPAADPEADDLGESFEDDDLSDFFKSLNS